MTIDKIIVGITSLAGIIFVYWFFLRREVKSVSINDSVDIVVKGGYSPEVISIPKGRTTTLFFIRKDPSSCLEEVVLPDFKVRRFLPLNKKVSVEINPTKVGEFIYSCGMNMFHGKIIVQ